MKKVLFGLLVVLTSFVVIACTTPAPAPAPAEPAPAPVVEAPRGGIILDGATNYTVVRGDTLAEIAAGKYGASNRYFFPLIQLANPAIVKDPDIIEIGDRLTIPNLQRNLDDAGANAAIRAAMLSTADRYERQSKPKAAAILKDLASRLAK
ncbi:MAG: LysM peptidoglycan-binding domain-containing protein [Spirochaetaceae bacterium]|jgi:Tfp pilus assembly protein FimV|nr:LysM peptidoglycan-binding domain-containing protein [Spirochaetaceae bacterium]